MDNYKFNILIMITIFFGILFISVGYSAYKSSLTISGEATIVVSENIKISSIAYKDNTNAANEIFNSSFENSNCSLFFELPNINSSITYTISILNETNEDFFLREVLTSNNNNLNLRYEIIDKENVVITKNSVTNVDVRFYYDSLLPENVEFSLNIEFDFYNTYSEEILNGADPVLNNGFIPVSISDSGTVTVADTQQMWYSYENKIWANAVILNNTSISYDVGVVIPMSEIKQMYVWIPRYSYDVDSIENENNAIDITFVNKSTIAHPAFTLGTDELPGMWVGKFETGVEFGEDMNDLSTHFSIKPNIFSVGPMDIYTMYLNVIKTNNSYGLDSSSDLHVIKNTEWGAVTYLTHSIYGICTSDTSCTPIVNNYFDNIYNDIITGCGGTTKPIDAGEVFDISICPADYRWNTVNGYKASNTRNISGIYDLSAGKYEYVMSFMKNPAGGVYTASSKYTQSNLPDSKYYDLYEENTDSTDSSKAIIGDGILEIKVPGSTYTWNYDYAIFHRPNSPFIVRSGRVRGWHYAGMFTYYGVTGSSSGGVGAFSTRNVISPI